MWGDDANSERLDGLETQLRETVDARSSLGAEAAAIADELDLLRARMLASEQEIRELEDGLEEISETLIVLQEELTMQEHAFAQQRGQLGDILASLQRIARQPAEMLIAMPTSPADTHRTAMLLAAITPELTGGLQNWGRPYAPSPNCMTVWPIRRPNASLDFGPFIRNRPQLPKRPCAKVSSWRRSDAMIKRLHNVRTN